jgi:branched-chain amino acid transport system permease protein
MAMAAYGLATTVATFDLPLWLGVLIGLAAAIVLALLLGIPTLRLRADYLAIVTIAAAEIVRLIARSVTFEETFGGSDGRQAFSGDFYAINPYSEGFYGVGSFGFTERAMWVLTVGWALVGLSCLVVFLLMRSPWGRVLKAIREDEDAVRSLGKNTTWYKMQSLMLGGFFGAMAGIVFAMSKQSVNPDDYATKFTFTALTVLILGGTARVLGPVVGAVIFIGSLQFLDVFLRQAIGDGLVPEWLPVDSNRVAILRLIFVGMALVLLMIFRPQGILGDRREVAIRDR